jgi:hypothetical protein
MAASERLEAQAKEMFDGGVNLDVPFTTKIDGDFVPSVNELKKPMLGGNMKTVGYRATFRFFPGRVQGSWFSRGGKRKHPHKYDKLPTYPTLVEADGRKYRDMRKASFACARRCRTLIASAKSGTPSISQESTAGTRPKCADPETKRRLQLLQ